MPKEVSVSRPTKSAAGSAEKPSIIFGWTTSRKRGSWHRTPQTPSLNPTSLPAAIVLDTNVVLDWLVFHNPACAPLAQGLADGHLCWLATAEMRDELRHVLARDVAAAWSPNHGAIWTAWERHAKEVPAVVASGAISRLRCTDADDQKFIDLALGHPARWLISRDRAVLKLARRSRAFGLDIVTPEAWAALQPAR